MAAYEKIPERQRKACLTLLGNTPANQKLSTIELIHAWLAFNGYTQPTLAERLAKWAAANNCPATLALTRVVLT